MTLVYAVFMELCLRAGAVLWLMLLLSWVLDGARKLLKAAVATCLVSTWAPLFHQSHREGSTWRAVAR